jgi:tripartite-type tricarboxylate transporter receptor subunit TctC
MLLRPNRRSFLAAALLASASLLSPLEANAQIASGKTITLIVSNNTKTTADILARLIAPEMSKSLGQPVIVENRPGGNGLVAMSLVAKAAPDGTTVLIDSSSFAVPPGPSRKGGVDPAVAFKPVAVLALFPYVFVTFPPYPAANVRDVVTAAKRTPNEVAYASTGTGSAQHLAAALLEVDAGIDLLNIPYRNSGLALSDVASRQVPLLFADYASVAVHLKESRLRALAVTSKNRLALLPDVPTMVQAGIADYEAYEWSPAVVPAATPPAIISQLSSAMTQAMLSPEFVAKVQSLGGEPFATGTTAAESFVADQRKLWTNVIRDRNIKLD